MNAQPRSATTDSLGCSKGGLAVSQVLETRDLVIRRKAAHGHHSAEAATAPQERGLIVGVSLVNGHRRRARTNGRHRDSLFDEGDVYLRDFDSAYSAHFEGRFDFCVIELPPDLLDRAGRYCERANMDNLRRVQAQNDPVLLHLCRALAPVFAAPGMGDSRFAEHMQDAMIVHVLTTYGTASAALPVPGALSPVGLRRAREMLMAEGAERHSTGRIAETLGMSRSAFYTAFRLATGQAPHQWLSGQRIDQARRLLRDSDETLADIALQCGFFDQSHFSRIFAKAEGMPPGRWRAQAK